jgi:hypothetical protein
LRVYSDDSCSSNEVELVTLSSDLTGCANLPPGVAAGSKEMTDLVYLPGKCAPTGGLAIGDVYPDESSAVTWCCIPSPADDEAASEQ